MIMPGRPAEVRVQERYMSLTQRPRNVSCLEKEGKGVLVDVYGNEEGELGI